MSKMTAERKFWKCPELVEMLVAFLDVDSIYKIAKCHQLTLEVVEVKVVWNKLIKKVCPESSGLVRSLYQIPYDTQKMKERLLPKRKELLCLVDILKLFEEPKTPLRALLDLVAKRFPPFQDGARVQHNLDRDEENNVAPTVDLNSLYGPQLVQVTSPPHQTHTVSPLGYLLLEEIENAFGCEEHKIVGMVMDILEEPWLATLASHQDEALGRLDTHTIKCDNKESVEVLVSLIQGCPGLNVQVLKIRGDIGTEGWTRLAKTLQAHLEVVRHLDAAKQTVLAARGGDLRLVWDALGPRGSWSVLGSGWTTFFRQEERKANERAWKMLINRIHC